MKCPKCKKAIDESDDTHEYHIHGKDKHGVNHDKKIQVHAECCDICRGKK